MVVRRHRQSLLLPPSLPPSLILSSRISALLARISTTRFRGLGLRPFPLNTGVFSLLSLAPDRCVWMFDRKSDGAEQVIEGSRPKSIRAGWGPHSPSWIHPLDHNNNNNICALVHPDPRIRGWTVPAWFSAVSPVNVCESFVVN
uniref:Uncharacterized protein n=1 Tax=Knipowitschia caucasica TaxID=637954 RepID=A0AAV2KQD5_KNICA